LTNGQLLAAVPADDRQQLEKHTLVGLLRQLVGDCQYGDQESGVEKQQERLKHLLSEFRPDITAPKSR
jgi:hypothetical protein